MAALPVVSKGSRLAAAVSRSLKGNAARLVDSVPREVVDDIFSCALKKQTGVSMKYMLQFGANSIERQLLLSAQFLRSELPVRLAHRVAELENLPYGLSTKAPVLKARSHPSPRLQSVQRLFPTVAPARSAVCMADSRDR